MTSIHHLPPVAETLGWTILHSLWQGALIALLVELIRRNLPARASQTRYMLAFSALNLLLILAVATFLYLNYNEPVHTTLTVPVQEAGIGMMQSDVAVIHPAEPGIVLTDWVPYLAPLWLVGYFLLLIRFLIGRISLWGLRTQARDILDPVWTERFSQLSDRLSIRRPVRLMTSSLTSVPITFGWLKPVILLPVGLINHIDPREVEAILIHELAHILRRDYLWNTWQQCLECLFYYHPLTWWLSRQITDEREHLCDEITLQQEANAMTYARALLHIQEWHALPRHPALAVTGRKDALLHRIQRIIDHSVNPDTMQRKWLIPMLLTLPIIAMTLMAWIPSAEGNSDPMSAQDQLALIDSLPQKKMIRKEIHKNVQKIVEENDGIREEATFENGKLTELLVNGKTIAPADYDNHVDLIARMTDNVSQLAPPPAPPTPPVAPDAPEIMDEEVMEWTSEDGTHEKKIIIRKGDPGRNVEKRMKTIIIDEKDEPVIWMGKDDNSGGEKRIEIIREEEINDGDGNQVFLFKSGGGDHLRKEIRIEKELADLERAHARDERVYFFKDDSGKDTRHMEVVIDGEAPFASNRFQFFGTKGGSIHERITNQMLEEGLIQSRNEYKYDLNIKRLKIDGRRMPDAVHQRYLKLYKNLTGNTMTDKDRLRADIDND